MAGPAAAPGVLRLLAPELLRDEFPDRCAEDVVVGDPEGGEEGELADQDGVLEAAGGRGLAGGDVVGSWRLEASTTSNEHTRDGEIGLVVRVGEGPILAHGHPTRQVARLEAAVHFAAARVQDVELAGHRIDELGAEHLVAAPADNQERVAGAVSIYGHDVVA